MECENRPAVCRIHLTVWIVYAVCWLPLCCAWPAAAPPTSSANGSSMAEEPETDKYALVIGMDAYDKPWGPLNYAVDDAAGFSRILQEKWAVRKNLIAIHTSLPPTPANSSAPSPEGGPKAKLSKGYLGNIIDGWVRDLPTQSVAIVYYAGHGTRGENGEFIVPEDCNSLDPQDLDEYCYKVGRLKSRLRTRNPRRVLLIMDACRKPIDETRSAAFAFPSPARASRRTARRSMSTRKAYCQPMDPTRGTALAAAPPTEWIELYGCRPSQTAMEPKELHHGLFTHFLMRALDGKDWSAEDRAAGAVTYSRLMNHLTGAMAGWLEQHNLSYSIQQPDGPFPLKEEMVLMRLSLLPGTPSGTAARQPETISLWGGAPTTDDVQPHVREAIARESAIAAPRLPVVRIDADRRRLDAFQESLGALWLEPALPIDKVLRVQVLAVQGKQDAERLVAAAYQQLSHREFLGARAGAQDALRCDPGNPQAHAILGNVLLWMKDLDRADVEIREAERLQEMLTPGKRLSLAHVARGTRYWLEADDRLFRTSLRAKNPRRAREQPSPRDKVTNRLYEEAGEEFRKALAVDPGELLALNDLGTVNLALARGKVAQGKSGYPAALALLDEAERQYRKALARDDYHIAHHNLGNTYILRANIYGFQHRKDQREQDLARAEDEYREALRLYQSSIGSMAQLAAVLLAQGKTDDAVSFAKQARAQGLIDHYVYDEMRKRNLKL
jgi:tetratricopeptide (TPR) repeat protein